MKNQDSQFDIASRIFHWILAAMVLAMLCIGVAMIASVASYHLLLSIHRPLGVAIMILVSAQFFNRILNPAPSFPQTMRSMERSVAKASEYVMYALMLMLPLVGWAMLSAARLPIVVYGSLHLPFILPHNVRVYAFLRETHAILAYFFFLTFLVHLGTILFHALIVRDGLLRRMAPWRIKPPQPEPRVQE